ncbi:phosphatase PAP2 family protein [Telluribacter humicola]|uniref:phosphatase PAP2 family protein n=1 Tax=Telluribacter humicola TaxID=1720261 RepID=UPI001A96638B|nr:phosphatase PAP2 family protein [Telluribacter humicola]
MKLFFKFFFLLLIFLHGAFGVRAQYATDTASTTVRPREFVIPAALMTSGLIVQGNISRQLQRQIINRYPSYATRADDFLAVTPAAFSLGLGAAGVKGKHPFGEQIILAIVSGVLAQGITTTFKVLSKYPRPDKDGFDSFASGHTTAAFTGATLLHQEYGHRSVWYSVGGYGVATSVATLRMLNNRHWLSDVLFGAGVGIGTTKAMYLLYPAVKRKVLEKRRKR